MINNLDEVTKGILNIYNSLEMELLLDIARRFDTYDTVGGTLEWHIKKLEEMGALNGEMVKTIAKYSKKSEAEILNMLKKAGYANIDITSLTKSYKLGQISVNPELILESSALKNIIEHSYKELNGTMRLIQTKALESAKQAYMDVLNKTYIEVSSGTRDFNSSIRRAMQSMASKGITGATYSRGGTIVQYSLEGTVRRDTLTACNQLANKVATESCKELGAGYVEVSSHLGARVHPTNPIANHAGWQGKVFKIDGSDKEYPNLKESTGYPDDIQGLGGVNCRHRIFPFFPGISTPNPIQYDEKENKRVYELTQKQRAMERKLRQLKKKKAVATACGDNETLAKVDKQILAKSNELEAFCKANDLVKDYTRENIIY
ncbi:MAG: phage minor capsid protein [Eubacterium sp.]